ncbi:MAG: hypothetical protein BA066_05800 [Candidatus Korarchaeota archaeon NZ13-K]|nr:MAG: hypothetical protein BA066_05800 [Candidatus Korarchaeota archaeon NZ13-K]
MEDPIRLLIMRRDPRETMPLFYKISDSIDKLSGMISSIGGYEVFIWSALSLLNSSLKFPAEVQLWVKLIPAFPMILFPLCTTDYGELSLYLADESGRSYMMLILASFLASVGLITNNLAVKIESMLLSSLMSVVVAVSMGLAVQDLERSLFHGDQELPPGHHADSAFLHCGSSWELFR